jgi:(E)-2-((N-methylformamido)methylene)succinate hydrolase
MPAKRYDRVVAPDGTAYVLAGNGPPAVFVHGLGLDADMWAEQVEALSGQFTVVAPDLLGHGLSPPPGQGAGVRDFARPVLALIESLFSEPARVIGFDLGGQVAIACAASQSTRVCSLTLISTAYRRLKSQRDMMLKRVEQARKHGPQANADSAIQRWFSAAFQSEQREWVKAVRDRIASNDADGYVIASDMYARADQETADMLRDIHVPTLVMGGALDMGATPAMAKGLAGAINGAKLQIVPRQRHMLPIEAAHIVNKLIADLN